MSSPTAPRPACTSESLSSGRTASSPRNPGSPGVLSSGYKLTSYGMEAELPCVRGYFLSLNIWHNTTTDFWISTAASSVMKTPPTVLEFPADLQRSFTNITRTEPSQHPKLLASPFYGEQSLVPPWTHPPCLVHSELSSPGAPEEKN